MHYLAALAPIAIALASPAVAATLVVSGDTTGEPTYNRPVTTTALSGVGTDVNYEATGFSVDTSGSYSLEITATGFPDGDSYLSLYSGSFDASDPLTNLIAVDDDSGTDLLSLINFTLTAGTSYIAVVTSFDNGVFGTYDLTISGPGAITLAGGPAVPEPAAWALMIGGFGMVGGAMRRRQTVKVTYA
ncbi:PEPxxWA-CTERM sorting domain-containing protein [Sphingomonas sp. 1P06PA]|uniref:PEPxxWA-CTERM sorting domain-containing protein n=1 Tax=Sphingomonas sp. 1P06PA TaxID=554121 RepID=UPI0039A5FB38